MITSSPSWQPLYTSRNAFGSTELNAVMSGEAACIVIDKFYPEEACKAISANVDSWGLTESFSGENVSATYSGRAAIELATRKEDYLANVATAEQKRQRLVGEQQDPMKVVLDILRNAWPGGARIATENGRPYFAGVIRIFSKAVPHNDFAPRDMTGWEVSTIEQQLSWNLFLAAPEEGGEFQIWQRLWVEEDERLYKHDPAKKKGYKEDVVKGCPSVLLEPTLARFILFDARYYHTILDVKGAKQRLAMSSFVGCVNQATPLLLWS